MKKKSQKKRGGFPTPVVNMMKDHRAASFSDWVVAICNCNPSGIWDLICVLRIEWRLFDVEFRHISKSVIQKKTPG